MGILVELLILELGMGTPPFQVVREATRVGLCIAAVDSSFKKEINPHLCSTVFILVCSMGLGVITGSFTEFSLVALSFRGELLGLMAIHLILLALHEVAGELTQDVHIYSDCKGALSKMRWLPP